MCSGWISQMVKRELHERWPDFRDNWKAVFGTLCGIQFARSAVSR